MANRYSGFGSRGSGPRRKASAAARANRARSTFRRANAKTRTSRKTADVASRNAVGGSSPGRVYHRSAR